MDETTTKVYDSPASAFADSLTSDPAQLAFSIVALNTAMGMMAARLAMAELDNVGDHTPPRERVMERAETLMATFADEGRIIAENNLRRAGILVVSDDPSDDPSEPAEESSE